ncbi:MAG: hypothetical protein H7Z21_05080, partial [Hymenobacter sp.]|nr:hypothetical protein [Hymenobacter sp.]
MVRFGLLRLLRLLLTAWVLATLLFILTHALLNEEQLLTRFAGTTASDLTASGPQIQAARQAARQRLGLAEPIFYISPAPPSTRRLVASRWRWNGPHNQYHHGMRHLLSGNLGRSYRT